MGIIKNRNSKDVKEGDEIKKTEQEYTKLYKKKKKGLTDLDNHNGLVIHLEPNILDYEVKRALSTKLVEMTYGWRFVTLYKR